MLQYVISKKSDGDMKFLFREHWTKYYCIYGNTYFFRYSAIMEHLSWFI
jgi:hypothetical protein